MSERDNLGKVLDDLAEHAEQSPGFEEFLGDDLEPQFGECCACRCAGSANNPVRNVVMHEFRAPIAGKGWGCVVCQLPLDGAVSVICDRCRDTEVEVVDVCSGYPAENVRVAFRLMDKTPFAHHPALHPGELFPREEEGRKPS